MATKKKTTKKKAPGKDELIDIYMDHVLEREEIPKTIYKFCKSHEITEADFYDCFGSFEALQKGIWVRFFEHAQDVIGKSKDYGKFDIREKMLTFYYTLFEILTANRSFVLFVLKQHQIPLKNLGQLKDLRQKIKSFAGDLIREENELRNVKVLKQSKTIFSEAAWLQFLFLLKFWMDDTSPKFESTDAAIEKSVNTGFDVFNYAPLERIMDFGKFMWKERRK
ncbi:MAG TPA: TetR family transcriptional regulator C-terminal domain-containing protein [Salinimicrobium sp.]|nr:TetR family transcriptional regulator C-terminal domain-containing protein [Salinimicrobium sp.]